MQTKPLKNKFWEVPLYFMVFLLSNGGCEEVYTPKLNVESGDLVVQAILTSEYKKHTIVLSKTNIYSNSKKFSGVPGAEVYIIENNEKRFEFTDCGGGYYTSDDSLGLQATHQYILYINTPDGLAYSSLPQTIQKAPGIDSVCVVPESIHKEYINFLGDKMYREIGGFSIHAVFTGDTDVSDYLAYQIDGFEQYFLTFRNGFNLGYTYLFCRRKTKFNLFSIISICNTNTLRSIGARTKVAVYDQDYFDAYRGTSSDIPATDGLRLISSGFRGMLIEIRQLSVSKEIYNGLRLREEQSNSEFRLFDPMMIQVPSNLICNTQPGKKVFGMFIVSDVSKKHVFITYDDERGKLNISEVADAPEDIELNCVMNSPPEDWIYPGSFD